MKRSLEQPGLTQDGAAWLAKCLHPADSTLTVNGIPTLDAVPSASLNFMTTQTISAPAAATWSCDVMVAPTPLIFGKAMASTGAAYSSNCAYNTTLGVGSFAEFGASGRTWHNLAITAWANNVHAYRLTYASVTATLSASATANEGVVSCAQYSLPYTSNFVLNKFNCSSPQNRGPALCRVYDYNRRSQSQLQATAGAVTWEAKKGVYSILKLGTGFDKWLGTRDGLLMVGTNGPVAADTEYIDGSLAYDFYAAAAASAVDCPFGQQATWSTPSFTGTGATLAHTVSGRKMLIPSSDNVSHLSFSGLDANASLNLTWRVGFEAVVPPESIYAGQVGSPVKFDQAALSSYFIVSREMMAGYPADYNIFGALLGAGAALLPKAIPLLRNVGGAVMKAITDPEKHSTSPTYSVNPPRQRDEIEFIPQRRVTQRKQRGRRNGNRNSRR